MNRGKFLSASLIHCMETKVVHKFMFKKTWFLAEG